MSTSDSIHRSRNILFKMGLIETLCFTITINGDWWFIKDNILIYSHWNSTGKCTVLIDFWDI